MHCSEFLVVYKGRKKLLHMLKCQYRVQLFQTLEEGSPSCDTREPSLQAFQVHRALR